MDTSWVRYHGATMELPEILVFVLIIYLCIYLFLSFSLFLGPLPTAYGGSQARGLIRAVAAGLHQSHSNVGSEPSLQSTPQLTATPDP